MSSQLHLVVNPGSRHGKPPGRQRVERLLRTQGYQVEVHVTDQAGDAEAYIASLDSRSSAAVIGGDGTIGEAVRGAARSGALLIPLPGGRGNDLCRYFGISNDLMSAVQAIPTYAERTIDAGSVDGQLYAGVATIGFDSIANDNANRSRLRGSAVYAIGALRALARWKPITFSITVDGEAREHTGWSVVVANSGRYGGGMQISPHSVIDDGLLEMVTIAEASKREFVRSLPAVFSGTHISNPLVALEQVRSVRVEAISGGSRGHRRRMAVFADGDKIGQVPCEITVVPGAVRVLTPPVKQPGAR